MNRKKLPGDLERLVELIIADCNNLSVVKEASDLNRKLNVKGLKGIQENLRWIVSNTLEWKNNEAQIILSKYKRI